MGDVQGGGGSGSGGDGPMVGKEGDAMGEVLGTSNADCAYMSACPIFQCMGVNELWEYPWWVLA